MKEKFIAMIMTLVLVTLPALDASAAEGFESDVNVYSSYNYLPVGSYDSADTVIIKSMDTEARTVTMYNTVAAKTYTLNYDGTTYVSDKYGTPMSIDQLSEGMIVNVNFFKSTRQLVDVQLSPDAWSYDSVTRYDLGGINSTATIGDRTYALTKGVQVFSQGKQTDMLSIVDGDAITVSGIGYDIYSIKVESGHGYVRLTDDEALVGGWIEIGGALITQVTEPGMLLTVPEGTYTVLMYNDNSSTTKLINVERNQEIILDCSEITAPVDTFGRMLFHVTPATATVTLDGKAVDVSGIIRTEYGIHEIVASAPGYDTLSRYVNVGNELSEITINLDESVAYAGDSTSASQDAQDPLKKTASGNSSTSGNSSKASGNSSSSNAKKTQTVTTSKYNRVYVGAPEGAEVYVDGVYAGLIPMSFRKTAGAHTIILKKSGYVTRSYTIYVYDDGEDMSLSFSELEPVSSSDSSSSGSSSSGSSSSGSSSSGSSSGESSGTDDETTEAGDTDDTDGQDDESGGSEDSGTDSGSESGTDAGTDSGNTDSGTSGGQSGGTSTGEGEDSGASSDTGDGQSGGSSTGEGGDSGTGTDTGGTTDGSGRPGSSGTDGDGGTDSTQVSDSSSGQSDAGSAGADGASIGDQIRTVISRWFT